MADWKEMPCLLPGIVFFVFESGKVFLQAFLLHLLLRHEPESGRIDAVTKTRRSRPVRKNVAEVGVTGSASHLDAPHPMGTVLHFHHRIISTSNRPDKARPAGPGIELVLR